MLPSSRQTSESLEATRYVFKPSLVGAAREFELTGDGLSWRGSGKSGVWPYNKIAAIRLSYRPVSMQSRRFRADIEDTQGERQTIYSTTWHTVALLSSQGHSYRLFIEELHRRIGQAGGHPVLVGGINRGVFAVGAILMMLVAIAMAGLLIRALIIGEFAGLLFLIGFAALFAWQIGSFMRRNRPRLYTLASLPSELLP